MVINAVNMLQHLRQIMEKLEHSERKTKIKPFIDKYNCDGINYSSEKDDLNNLRKTM